MTEDDVSRLEHGQDNIKEQLAHIHQRLPGQQELKSKEDCHSDRQVVMDYCRDRIADVKERYEQRLAIHRWVMGALGGTNLAALSWFAYHLIAGHHV